MSNLDDAMNLLMKKFGKNYIGLGSKILDRDYKRHSSGVFSLDYATGGGLLVKNKIVLMVGRESSGKSSIALIAIAETQKRGGKVALLDVEHGIDPVWATKLGVDINKLIIAQPKSIEEVSDTIEPLIMTGELDLIVLDSVVAAPSDKELEDSAEQKSMGGNAKVVGLMMKKLTARLNDVNNPVETTIILLNQIRDNVGGWGAPEYIPSGRALKFHSDIIVWLKPNSKFIGKKENPEGVEINFNIKKNRTSPPFKIGSFELMFNGAVNNKKALIEVGVVAGVVGKVGYKYSFGDKSVTDIKPFTQALTDEDYENIRLQILASKEIVSVPSTTSQELDVNLEGTV